jgi:hypothetical protein
MPKEQMRNFEKRFYLEAAKTQPEGAAHFPNWDHPFQL